MELSAQHCLTIAAGFIAIIAACATLITSANNKAESISTRIRVAMKEHRERSQDSSRCMQLADQIALFKKRFIRVQRAQRLLFSTISLFIASLAIFIGLGLYIMYKNVHADAVNTISHTPILVIGVCVASGTLFMLAAIYYQFLEIGASYITLCIETRDCPTPDPSEVLSSESIPIAKGAAG